MSEPIRFTVIGTPQPAGSKRAFPIKRKNGSIGVAVSDSNPKAKSWKSDVACAAIAWIASNNGPPLPLSGPLSLSMDFFLRRPKGHFNKWGKLRQAAPQHPTVRPDTQKLARGTTDSLTEIMWRDDSQIIVEHLAKQYGEPARCEITIQEIRP